MNHNTSDPRPDTAHIIDPMADPAPNESCEWCGKVHDNPVRVDPFTLGELARSLGAEAFAASCELINQRVRGL